MVKIDKIYESNLVSVFLISSKYDIEYKEKDYNPLPAISFPIRACFRYKSGKFDRIVDTDVILIETGNIEFEVAKFSQFTHDLTLSFQLKDNCYGPINKIAGSGYPAETLNRTPQIETLVRLFLSIYSNSSKLLKDELIDEMLYQYLLNHTFSGIKDPVFKPWLIKKIETVKDYIHCQSSEDISITDISAVSNLSSYHFSRIFKQKTGYSLYEYLLKVRIEKAKQLLGIGTSVTAVAFEVGFNSLENFSYCFKKNVGISPFQFKKSKISKTS